MCNGAIENIFVLPVCGFPEYVADITLFGDFHVSAKAI